MLGSSIVARVNQNELPLDVEIIPYSGSTTDEKMTILQKTNFAQLKTIIIQNGTNSILKETNKLPDEIANNIKALIYMKILSRKRFSFEKSPQLLKILMTKTLCMVLMIRLIKLMCY